MQIQKVNSNPSFGTKFMLRIRPDETVNPDHIVCLRKRGPGDYYVKLSTDGEDMRHSIDSQKPYETIETIIALARQGRVAEGVRVISNAIIDLVG